MLPNSQPQSAPEITLLGSRMILGKTVDDLNLQIRAKQDYFPAFGRGLARLLGEKPNNISISRLYIKNSEGDEVPEIKLTVLDERNYKLDVGDLVLKGKTGSLLEKDGIALLVDKIEATPGTTFSIKYVSRLKAISDLQEALEVADHIARQAAQDAKSLDFLNEQLPQVRSDLDLAEDKLNKYRQQNDSVDLSLEAKSVLDQIVNVDNQLNELTFRESEIHNYILKSIQHIKHC